MQIVTIQESPSTSPDTGPARTSASRFLCVLGDAAVSD
jgi:hypothetical protein